MSAGKHALITGINGQDGYYLTRLLLSKGYTVSGVAFSMPDNLPFENETADGQLTYILGDITDRKFINNAIAHSRPDEVYNLAAQSNKLVSFENPLQTAEVNGFSVAYMLEALRQHKPDVRFFQASSALVIEDSPETLYSTRYDSPYTTAKMFAQLTTQLYRTHYKMFSVCGILYNHESERRKVDFLPRKISKTVADIALGSAETITLGNLDSYRDWCHAEDAVNAMWLMLQSDEPDDYVIASGEKHSAREFVTIAFEHVGIKLRFEGSGIDETGIDEATGKVCLKVAENFYRSGDSNTVTVGDPSKLCEKTGWKPQISFESLVKRMVEADLNRQE